jgi:hypothetical protein
MLLFGRVSLFASNRLFEWVAATILLGISLHLVMWPDAVSHGRFSQMAAFVGPEFFGRACLVVGFARLFFLAANGSMPVWGPRLRAIGAIAGSLIWLQLAAAPILNGLMPGSTPSNGIPVYLGLALGDLISTYRAAADARHRV